MNTRPLWCCVRLPAWMSPSLASENRVNAKSAAIFKAAKVARIAGVNSPFLRSLAAEDTRSILDDLSIYDAFRDGFLLLPALERHVVRHRSPGALIH